VWGSGEVGARGASAGTYRRRWRPIFPTHRWLQMEVQRFIQAPINMIQRECPQLDGTVTTPVIPRLSTHFVFLPQRWTSTTVCSRLISVARSGGPKRTWDASPSLRSQGVLDGFEGPGVMSLMPMALTKRRGAPLGGLCRRWLASR
jgi:hypothetical protein